MCILRKNKEVTFRKRSMDLWPPGVWKLRCTKCCAQKVPLSGSGGNQFIHGIFPFNSAGFCSLECMHASVAPLCLTLCDPMDCSPPDSSVCGILQARIPEWVAIPVCRRSSWPRDRTQVSCIAGRFFTVRVTREAQQGLGKGKGM